MSNLVWGIDPGLATGNALYDLDTCKPYDLWESGNGIKGFRPDFDMTFIAHGANTHIACENFTLRSKNKFTADLSGVKIIGWLEGEDYCRSFPEPIQHMTLTKLREKKDSYADSKITHLMKAGGFKIGKGHTRMALSVAVWHAAMVLKHEPTLEMLSPRR